MSVLLADNVNDIYSNIEYVLDVFATYIKFQCWLIESQHKQISFHSDTEIVEPNRISCLVRSTRSIRNN